MFVPHLGSISFHTRAWKDHLDIHTTSCIVITFRIHSPSETTGKDKPQAIKRGSSKSNMQMRKLSIVLDEYNQGTTTVFAPVRTS